MRERRVLFAGGLGVDLAFVDPDAGDRPGDSFAEIAGVVLGRGVRVLIDKPGQSYPVARVSCAAS